MRINRTLFLSFLAVALSLCCLSAEASGNNSKAPSRRNSPKYADPDFSSILFDCAKSEDLSKLVTLYQNFTTEDRKNLVVYPEPFLTPYIQDAIDRQRMFVARDLTLPASENIIAFAIAYVVTDPIEKQRILAENLRIIPNSHGDAVLKSGDGLGFYSTGYNRFPDLSANPLKEHPLRQTTRTKSFDYSEEENQTYIYLGNCYTIQQKTHNGFTTIYRRKGISTMVESHAFKAIHEAILADIYKNPSEPSTRLMLLYGIVEQHIESRIHIRVFSECTHRVKLALGITTARENFSVRLNYFTYHSYKPVLFLDTLGNLNTLPDEHPIAQQSKGFGCILAAHLDG